MREVTEAMELASTLPGVDVSTEEYVRLLGFPARLETRRPLPGIGELGP